MNLGENKELTLQAGERPGSLDTAAACVLLVDDQPARLLTYESILEGVGVTCVRALSGEEALKRLLKQEFAVIVLDVSMPGMDGFETARLIRSHHRFERTPIIFVTGVHVSELDTLRGYEVGGIDYISVPLVPEILRSKVALLVELYRRRTELQRVNAQLEQARAQLQTERDETIAASRAQLEEREARYHAIFEHPTEATVVLEAARTADGRVAEWRYRDANANALKVLRRSRETLIGKSLAEILPEGAQALADRCKTVLFERAALRYEEEDSGRRFLICLFPIGENTIVSSGLDITARRRAEEEIERAMRADRAEKEWLAAVLNSMNEEVYFTDRQGRYSYANPAAVSEFGYDGLEGADVRQLVSRLEVLRPDGTPRGVEEAPPLRALGGEMIRQEDQIVRIPRTGELRHRQVSSAPVRDMNGSIIGSVSVVRDVTEQKHAEELLRARDARSTALLRLGDKFRTLIAPADLAFAAAEMLGETLRVSRCGYGTIDPIAETITVERDWNAPGIATIAGVLRFREYGTYIEELKRGQTVICTDARTDPRTRDSAAALEHIKARSFVNMPVTEEVGVVALLYLNHESARTWSDEELAFIREVAHRTRVAVERRRGEQALAADLRYTNLLRHLAVRSVAEDNIRVLYEAILDAAIEITSADAGALQLFDDCTQTPRSVAIRGLPQELTHHLEQVNAPSGPPSAVALARGERVMLNLSDSEVAVADDASRIYRDSGLHSAQSTPLMSRSGRTLGMISTYWRSPHVLRERELRFLDLLARQATDLIDRSQVEEAIRESEQRLRAAAAEREQLLESERSARAEAERLSRMKDEFLATLSHELRTPLHSILGWASLMRNRGVGSVDYARGLEIIERNARAQSEIIAELLEMTSVVAGKIQLEARPVDLSQVLTNATDAVRPAADAKGIRLRVTLDAAATGVRGDASRLQQVFWNLLTNAVKFTLPGGDIDVSLTRADSNLEISVADSGIGIEPEFLPHVFERFRQADSSTTRRYGGLGLGLALVKHLVELHGGVVTALSAGEDRGSTFKVVLPLAADLDSPPADRLPPGSFAPPNLELPGLNGVTALLVDDDPDALVMVSKLIERQGGRAIAAANAGEALKALETQAVDILVSDIGMPDMDGHTLIKRIRSSEATTHRSIPAIALTAHVRADERQRILSAGYQMHLSKPVELRELIAGIASLVRVVKPKF